MNFAVKSHRSIVDSTDPSFDLEKDEQYAAAERECDRREQEFDEKLRRSNAANARSSAMVTELVRLRKATVRDYTELNSDARAIENNYFEPGRPRKFRK